MYSERGRYVIKQHIYLSKIYILSPHGIYNKAGLKLFFWGLGKTDIIRPNSFLTISHCVPSVSKNGGKEREKSEGEREGHNALHCMHCIGIELLPLSYPDDNDIGDILTEIHSAKASWVELLPRLKVPIGEIKTYKLAHFNEPQP